MANSSFVSGTPDDEFVSDAAQAAIAAQDAADQAEAAQAAAEAAKTSIENALANYLPLAGGTMTGDLVLAGDPTADLEAATKQYVDNQIAAELADASQAYDIGVFLPDSPDDGFETILMFPVTTGFTLPQSLTGSEAYANTAPDAETVFDLQKNNVSFGTVTFGAGSNEGTFAALLATTFEAGDILEVIGPEYADAYLADISVVLKGTVS